MSGPFMLQLQEFARKTGTKADDAVGRVTGRVIKEIDDRSPVGERERWAVNIDRASRGLPPVPKGYVGGRFRGNWQLGVGVVPSGVLDHVDPSGEGTVSAALAAIPERPAGTVLYYVNNLAYAWPLERGHSTIAPEGIVGLTVIQFQRFVDEEVGSLK